MNLCSIIVALSIWLFLASTGRHNTWLVSRVKRCKGVEPLNCLRRLARLCWICFPFAGSVYGQPFSYERSFPDIFTYFDPSSTRKPIGASMASDAVVAFQRFAFNIANGTGTGFLIRTFRSDNKVGLCLTGHQIQGILGRVPVEGEMIPFNQYIYMKYLGKDSVSQGKHYSRTTNYVQGYLDVGELKAYFLDDLTGEDIALVLVDKGKLPVVSYTELGYDFSDVWEAAARYYTIGHPYYYPQCIADNLNRIAAHRVYGPTVASFWATTDGPNAVAPGWSGGPLITRTFKASASPVARGVLTECANFKDEVFSPDGSENKPYCLISRYCKINRIEPAIRQHCWRQSDSSQISASAIYKQSATVDNTAFATPYTENRVLNSLGSFLSSSGALIETLPYYGQKGVTNIMSFYLRGKFLKTLNFPIPNRYPFAPYANYEWVVSLVGEIVELGGGFSYTALDNSELNVAAVTTDSLSITTTAHSFLSGKIPTDDDEIVEGGNSTVYPNPSGDGIFYISIPPEAGQCRLTVHSSDGRRVFEALDISSSPYRLDLSAFSKGAYVLVLSSKGTGEKLVRKLIIL